MSIISSVIVVDRNEGGTRFIKERHTDSAGVVHTVQYFCPVGFDATAKMAARVVEIERQLAETEVDGILR